MATTLDAAKTGTFLTLSGGNLVATNGNGFGVNQTTASGLLISGKKYFEGVFTGTGTGASIGLANSSHNFDGDLRNTGTATSLCFGADGFFYAVGYAAVSGFPGFTNGDRVCFAIDEATNQLWIRLGTTGDWNADPSADPGANTGGGDYSAFGVTGPFYAAFGLYDAGSSWAVAFASGSWAGIAPSGFTEIVDPFIFDDAIFDPAIFDTGVTGSTYSDSVTETATATHSQTATLAAVGATAETATATETSSAVQTTARATTEAATATHSQSATIITNVATAETATAADQVTGGILATAATAELATATETSAATVDLGGATTEAATATETASAVAQAVAAVAEAATATETSSAVQTTARGVTEAATATEQATAGLDTPVAIAETATATDSSSTTLTASAAIAEVLARTNRVLQSETFDNASWTKAAGAITANATTAPDGTTTADLFTEDASIGVPRGMAQSVSISPARAWSLSAEVKPNGRNWLRLFMDDGAGTNFIECYFDIANGVVGTATNGGTGSGATGTITPRPNGFLRCTLSGVPASAGSTTRLLLRLASANSTPTYAGNNVSGVYFWGAQFEAGLVPTPYIPTTTAAVTVDGVVETAIATSALNGAATEAATATEDQSATLTTSAAVSETATATDAPDATVTAAGLETITETATATDSCSATIIYAVFAGEAATTTDAPSATMITSASITETATAFESASATGGTDPGGGSDEFSVGGTGTQEIEQTKSVATIYKTQRRTA